MRPLRALAVALTVVLLAFAAVQLYVVLEGAVGRGEAGYDAGLYIDNIAQRWLATGEAYYPVQFAGPYPAEGTVNLYPPLALYLFLPFTVLPRVLWWAVPLALLAWHLWTARPTWWSWPLMAFAACTVHAASTLVYGNSDLWMVAFLALACRFAPAALLLTVKPSVVPLALLFARDRRWWAGVTVLIAAAIPFGDLWVDWFVAIGNVEAGPLRSLPALPVLAVPIIAWLGRAR